MSTELVVTTLRTSLAEAERMLLSCGVDELFVVDDGGALCGVVPDYELLKVRMTAACHSATVESVMSRRFLVIGPESPLTVAARYLREHVHRRLAVIDEGRLIGQVTRRSVIAWLRSEADAAAVTHRHAGPTQIANQTPPEEPRGRHIHAEFSQRAARLNPLATR